MKLERAQALKKSPSCASTMRTYIKRFYFAEKKELAVFVLAVIFCLFERRRDAGYEIRLARSPRNF
jgi:hypothetical protein